MNSVRSIFMVLPSGPDLYRFLPSGEDMLDEGSESMRQAVKEDVPAIRSLTRAAYSKWVPIIGREPMPMTVDYDLAIRVHRFDLLERSGMLVALVETMLHPDHLWVENLAVSPDRHGQGVGHRLLEWVEHAALSLGHRKIRLLTNPLFTGNVQFYERRGFIIEREEAFKGGVLTHLCKLI